MELAEGLGWSGPKGFQAAVTRALVKKPVVLLCSCHRASHTLELLLFCAVMTSCLTHSAHSMCLFILFLCPVLLCSESNPHYTFKNGALLVV